MAVSVFLASWTPLAVALVGGTVGPFVFQFWFSLAMCLVWFAYLIAAHPQLVGRHDSVWLWIARRLRTRDGVLAMLNGFNQTLFVWAALFLDAAVVTVITGAHVILFVAYRRQHDRSNRYRRMGFQDWLLMGAALAGVGLVTLSQFGGVTTEGGWRLLWGVLLAVACAFTASWMSFRFRLGKRLYDRGRGTAEGVEDRKDELACVLAVSLVANVPGMVSSLLIGLTFFPGETGTGVLSGFVSVPVVWVVILGTASSLGHIAFVHANLETTNLGVNAMNYLNPVLSLVWLGWFATVDVARADFLWVGAATVIAANALINFRAEDRARRAGSV